MQMVGLGSPNTKHYYYKSHTSKLCTQVESREINTPLQYVHLHRNPRNFCQYSIKGRKEQMGHVMDNFDEADTSWYKICSSKTIGFIFHQRTRCWLRIVICCWHATANLRWSTIVSITCAVRG